MDDDQFPSNDFEDIVEEHSEAAYHEARHHAHADFHGFSVISLGFQ